MSCGLFGKIPAKRDFISVNAPGSFLGLWEQWLESAMAASRQSLSAAWTDVFLRAPIWRFWLGAAHAGVSATGAFMPSMDGVGRYFPLTVFALSGDDGTILPPFLDPQEAFFDTLEDFMLATLDPETPFEAIRDGLGALPAPAMAGAGLPPGIYLLASGMLAVRLAADDAAGSLGRLAGAEPQALHDRSTFWWTLGGEGFPALALSSTGMPDPYAMTGMLTGRFGVQE